MLNDLYYIVTQLNSDPVLLHNLTFIHLLYADDLVLISKSAAGLQCCLDAVQKFCNDWNQSNGIFQKKKPIPIP